MSHLEAMAVARKLAAVYAEIIKSEPQGVPSGVLYAAAMGYGITLPVHQALVGALKSAGHVKESGHLLTWIGK